MQRSNESESKESQKPTPKKLPSELDRFIQQYGYYSYSRDDKQCGLLLEQIKNIVFEKGHWKVLDAEGNTALHLAVLDRNFEVLRILLTEINPNSSIRNSAGQTPADLALEQCDLFTKEFCENIKDRKKLALQARDKGLEVNALVTEQIKVVPKVNAHGFIYKREVVEEKLEHPRIISSREWITELSDYSFAEWNRRETEKARLEKVHAKDDWRGQSEADDKFMKDFAYVTTLSDKTSSLIASILHASHMDGAKMLNKCNARYALQTGDIKAIETMQASYDRTKDYGRAMIFACLAAISCEEDSGNKLVHTNYIKDFFVKNSSFMRGELVDLQTLLLDYLKDDKLARLKTLHPKVDPITLFLMAMPNIDNATFVHDKEYLTDRRTKKLISSFQSVLADFKGIEKKDAKKEIAHELHEKVIAAHNKIVNTEQQAELQTSAPRSVTMHVQPRRHSLFAPAEDSETKVGKESVGVELTEAPKRPGVKKTPGGTE